MLARMRRRREQNAREARIAAFLKENAAFRRYVLRELERRGPLLSREIEDHAGQKREPHRVVGRAEDGADADGARARGQVAVVGRRQGQRMWDLAERWYPEVERIPWPRSASGSSPSGARGRRASASRRGAGSRTRTRPTAPCRTAPSCSPLSTGSSTTATAPRRSGTSATAWRCTSRRRSASTATTCSRCSSATGSSAAPSRSSTRRPTRSACSARGATPRASTRRSQTSRRGSALASTLDGLRDPCDPRGPGAGPGDRRGHRPDLPDLHLRRRRRSASTRATTTRAAPTRRAARSRSASPRSRAPSTASPSRPGMGATTTIMHLVSPGERIVAVNDVYGGTYRLVLEGLRAEGLRVRRSPPHDDDRRARSTSAPASSGSRRRRTRC